MCNKIQLKIAGINIIICCEVRKINMPLYKEFLYINNETKSVLFDIEIYIKEAKILDKTKIKMHKTYEWNVHTDMMIMTFAKRGHFLDESKEEDIWTLVGNKERRKWTLFIPDLSLLEDNQLINELTVRPWLQRLFICYTINNNYVVIHGALCNVDNKGILFLGESGVGKSTICSIIEKKYKVYSDDRVVLCLNEDHIVAFGTPWNIKNKIYCQNNSTVISKIIFLSHGNNTIYLRKENFQLVKDLMQQILHCNAYNSIDLFNWKMSLSQYIISKVPLYNFAFIPNDSCLNYLDGETI